MGGSGRACVPIGCAGPRPALGPSLARRIPRFEGDPLPARQSAHENGRVIKNLRRQGTKVKKCVPEPSESAKLHQTGPVSASEHGHEAAVLVQATNDTVLESAFACNRPVGLASGVERLRSIPNFDSNLEA